MDAHRNFSPNVNATLPNVQNFVQINFSIAVLISALDIMAIILGSLANILLVALVFSYTDLRKRTDVFSTSLCISDLMAGVFFQPFVIRRLLARHPQQNYEWALRRCIGQATLSGSALSLLMATVDRYIVIQWPLRYENIMTEKMSSIFVSGIWLISFSMGATAYFRRELSAVVFPCVISVIVISIVATHISIFIIAKKQENKIWKQSRLNKKGKKFLSKMRATKTIFLLLLVFLLSWLPSTIFRFYDRLSGGNIVTFHTWLHPLNCLIQVHCSLDPFLYVLRNRRFKVVIEKVFERFTNTSSNNRSCSSP
ncbi:adenosine receptor A1-like [Xenia sp. Carnegie-2017]|uniref:adenosine receptor A1-like n=1 Tax=Xenia sp. Carnegie-2017 TaxID=2897299 RepID=UPI001F049514|nr:adenosine receptor A1-like [Xenia sp. Carnegie-2017]